MSESERQAGAEIEVTEEMIEAGMKEFAGYHYELFNEDEVIASIFRAMLQASQHLRDRRSPQDQCLR